MQFPFFQLNAFSASPFGGNPAGVCLVETWPEPSLMQAVSRQQGIATAFVRKLSAEGVEVRYFLPFGELPFVGHASLAVAKVLLSGDATTTILLAADRSLRAERRADGRIEVTLPAVAPRPIDLRDPLEKALGAPILETWSSDSHYFARLSNEGAIRSLKPDMELLMEFAMDSIVATAPGESSTFVSRAFAPKEGLPEDPVCGSAHLTLVPYWSQVLGRSDHHALQLSERGGELFCALGEDGSVRLAGDCALFLEGSITV